MLDPSHREDAASEDDSGDGLSARVGCGCEETGDPRTSKVRMRG